MLTARDHLVSLPGRGARLAVTPLAGRAGLRLSGEADVCYAAVLREAIAALPANAGEIYLQLASLEFIDVAAARELVQLAGGLPGRA